MTDIMEITTQDVNITINQSLDTMLEEKDPTKVFFKQLGDVGLVVLLAVTMVSLGCTIYLDQLIKQIKKPLPAVIGMLLQFVAYPLIVFGMVYVFQMNQFDSLGMLILGTCPGGVSSNIFTYWCSGDITLSVFMTTASTAIAIGMMPLNLFIYSRAFISSNLTVPFVKIVIGLVLIIIPVAIGMVILRKLPRVAAVITKVGSIIGFLTILLLIAIFLYLYPEMFNAKWNLWCAAMMLPIFGLTVGYIGGRIICLGHSQCLTIGIEVSAQNVSLCLTLVFISFDVELASKIILFPMMFGVFSILISILLTIICKVVSVLQQLSDKKQHRQELQTRIETTDREMAENDEICIVIQNDSLTKDEHQCP